jgi:hypothetical protein
MSGAIPGARPVPVAKPVEQPTDLPADLNLPLGNDTELQIENGQGVTLRSEIGGTKLDLRLDENGVSVKPAPPPPADKR